MLGAERLSPGAHLNLAENLLAGPAEESDPAIVFVREDGQRRMLTWAQLRVAVATTTGCRRRRRGAGDRVAAWMPNVPETVVAFLATNAIEQAVFSSTSADFGAAAS